MPETSMTRDSRREGYRRDIDGLRAIAILSVVFFHAGVPIFSGGFVGVDVFFVISGYLIGAHVYADVRWQRFRIRDFYRKRAKRILPALLVVLGFCELMAVLVLSPAELTRFASYCIVTLASAANVMAWLKSSYFAPGTDQNPLLMAWSLGVEEQFYILFPLLMILLQRVRRKSLLAVFGVITVVSLAACWAITRRSPSAAFYLLPTRSWELAAGVLLAIYEDRRDRLDLYGKQRFADAVSWIGIVLIGIAVFRFDANTAFPGLAAVLPVLGSAMLLASPASWFNRWVMGSAPLVFVGQVSYSLYLWHWPLLSFSHVISDEPLTVAMGCGIAIVSFGCACLSYWFVERPFRRSETPAVPILLRYAALCVVMALPAVVYREAKGLPGRFAPLQGLEAARDDIARDCAFDSFAATTTGCMNRSDPRPAVALIGDSHAAAMAPAMARIAEAQGFKVYRIFKYSCAPLVGVARFLNGEDDVRDCLRFNAESLQALRSDPSVRTVVLSSFWAGPEVDHVAYVTAEQVGTVPSEEVSERNLARGLHDAVAELRSAGKKVVLVQDVPVFRFDPVRRMISDSIPVRSFIGRHLFRPVADRSAARMDETYEAAQERAAKVIEEVAAEDGVELFDPRPNLCHEDVCRFLSGDGPLYGDPQHLTSLGAERAAAGFTLP